jgi:hypothetical protein
MDIHCAKCGEPWDSYGVHHGDLTPAESRRFLRGEGCPSCNFGTTCTQCGGSGKERDAGSRCYCRGEYFIIGRLLDARNGKCFASHNVFLPLLAAGKVTEGGLIAGQPIPHQFLVNYNYDPHVKVLDAGQRARATFMKFYAAKECRDGWFGEVKLACPLCDVTKAFPCTTCKGTGKLVTEHEDKQELFQVVGQLLGGDQDGATAMLEDMS